MQWAGFDLSTPIVMGIINVTPDSFSDGGDITTVESAINRAEDMCQAGARILDIGGESTRPSATVPSLDEEIERVVPVIAAIAPIAKKYGAKISIDTRRAAVMAPAVRAGAEIINDISALAHDDGAMVFAAEHQLPVVLCHMRGTPQTMQNDPHYDDVVREVCDELAARMNACETAGLSHDKICIDPGIGFGKTTAHNIALLQNLTELQKLRAPILVGLSRKRMIGEITSAQHPKDQPKNRLAGSLAGALFAVSHGANILRVHDVRETMQALQMWRSLAGDTDISRC